MSIIYEPKGKYVVYMHISPNDKRYIGVTKLKPKYRWDNGNGYKKNDYFTNAIKKYGWNNFQHIILFINLTQKQAELKERELILQHNSTNEKLGYNLEFGGNLQKEISERTRERMSKAMIKRMSNIELRKKISKKLKGRKQSKEARQNSAKARIGLKLTEEHKAKLRGRVMSDEAKRKSAESKFKPVKQYTKDGIFLKKYPSQKQASLENNINASWISQCVTGVAKTAGGYSWV